MIRYDQRHTAATPTVPEEIRSIDWILARLRGLAMQYPARINDLRPRIDSALDERLRLMRLRDDVSLFFAPGGETPHCFRKAENPRNLNS